MYLGVKQHSIAEHISVHYIHIIIPLSSYGHLNKIGLSPSSTDQQINTCLNQGILTTNLYAHHCASFKKGKPAVAGVAPWIECQPANQRVTGSIPSQGTCLVPSRRHTRGNHISMFLSPSFSLPSPLSKNK